jgi:hypothetical protein
MRVEGWPVHRLIACAACPCRVSTTVTEASLMTYQHFAGAEGVPVGAARGRAGNRADRGLVGTSSPNTETLRRWCDNLAQQPSS